IASLEADKTSLQSELETAQAATEAARQEVSEQADRIASLEADKSALQAELESAQADTAAVREQAAEALAASESEVASLQAALAAAQAELARVSDERDALQVTAERELAALRAVLPPEEGGSLDAESARAAAAEPAETLREAHRAMRRSGADREALEATVEQAASDMQRAQSLLSRTEGGTLYQVGEGETLSSIAARFYGEGNAWTRIYQANQHVLENPDQVWPGTTLILP
ncbi:MAG: LysM peptidoglycan-binding domain-containing protein, partial [Pseudomonadota bacterium]